MKNIYYKVAHRSQEEIETFKTRYDIFNQELIPEIFRDALNLTVAKYEQSKSWGTSHVIYFVTTKEKPQPLVLRANIGFGSPEVVMLTEKLITEKVLSLKVPTNKILFVDVSRKKYHFDFQIQEKLDGVDLESHFAGSQEEYDELSILLGMYLAKIHTLKLPGFGLFDPEATLKNKLEGLHTQFFDYITTCLDDDIRYLFEAKIISKELSKKLRGLFDERKKLISISQGVLIHHDLADHNIMFKGNRITGIFDWEAAVVGDPVLDLASCITWSTPYPREEKLIEGYKTVTSLPDNFAEKMNIYRLRTMLWKMVFAIRMNIVNDQRRLKFLEALLPFGIKKLL